jgi:hypothetical protein
MPTAVAGFISANEDEDTLTGEVGAALRSGRRRVFVEQSSLEVPATWTWEITYYKFRGRGPRAPESFLGADGIVELNVTIGSRQEQKSLLFQAKVAGHGGRDLLEQALKLSTWREAATIFIYGESGYRALSIDPVIASRGILQLDGGRPLNEYLGLDFLECLVGDTELQYDARRRRLAWRAMDGERIATRFALGHRIGIFVSSPQKRGAPSDVHRVVDPEQAHLYRMEAEDIQVLGLETGATARAIRAARNKLALTYHPDAFGDLSALLRDAATRRMQEINAAVDRITAKRKH